MTQRNDDIDERRRRSDTCRFIHLPVTSANPEQLGALDEQYGQIRPAGPQFIRDHYDGWDIVDESSDQSFPASDSPSYMPGRD